MLSFLVRPLTVGTVIGGSLAAVESLAPLAAPVLDAARPGPVVVADRAAAVPTAGSEALETCTAGVVEDVARIPSVGIWFSFADGRASLLAAQPIQVAAARTSELMVVYLTNEFECISL